MRLRLETGHTVSKDVMPIDGDRVRFVTEDGRTMFEVVARPDGRSIEVRGVDACKVGETLYSQLIEVRPQVANCIVVRAQVYEDY